MGTSGRRRVCGCKGQGKKVRKDGVDGRGIVGKVPG